MSDGPDFITMLKKMLEDQGGETVEIFPHEYNRSLAIKFLNSNVCIQLDHNESFNLMHNRANVGCDLPRIAHDLIARRNHFIIEEAKKKNEAKMSTYNNLTSGTIGTWGQGLVTSYQKYDERMYETDAPVRKPVAKKKLSYPEEVQAKLDAWLN